MLGFSLPKLIVLFVIVAAIWYGFKHFARIRSLAKSDRQVDGEELADPIAVDMVRCATCGDYFVPVEGATSCNKHD